MSQDSMELALIKYNKKTWFKSALLGFIIGMAVIVPGISGSTVAIIFKLYDQFLYAIGNLFKRFKVCFLFLLPIGIGLVIGFGLGFISVQQLLELNIFVIICLFAGLMSGAFPAVKDELKGAEKTPKRIALFLVGLAIPVIMGCVSAALSVNAPVESETAEGIDRFTGNMFLTFAWWQPVLAVLIGFVVGITQIVPGLSASAFLMSVGWYHDITQSVDLTFNFWKTNPLVFLVYIGLGIGFLAGIFACSKALTWIFNKARQDAYSVIVGLSLGSIVSMFCNGDVLSAYLSWGTAEPWKIVLDIGLGAVLYAVGFVVAYLLVRFERTKSAEAAVENSSEK